MSGVGYFAPRGVTILGPCRTEGSSGYGAGPAPVRCPCLGEGGRGRLQGGGGLCQVEFLEAGRGVQDPREVVCQSFGVIERGHLWPRTHIAGDGLAVTLFWGEGGMVRVCGLDHSQLCGGPHGVHGKPLWPEGGGCGKPFDYGH